MRNYYLSTFVLILFLAIPKADAQTPINNECLSAIQLDDLDNWCSPVAFYTNVNATPTGPDPFCFPDVGLDVWFSFVAVGTDVSINVIGNTPSNPGGSLNNPQFAIYSGNCGNLTEIQCSSDAFGI
jgi:hypothetical protein